MLNFLFHEAIFWIVYPFSYNHGSLENDHFGDLVTKRTHLLSGLGIPRVFGA